MIIFFPLAAQYALSLERTAFWILLLKQITASHLQTHFAFAEASVVTSFVLTRNVALCNHLLSSPKFQVLPQKVTSKIC